MTGPDIGFWSGVGAAALTGVIGWVSGFFRWLSDLSKNKSERREGLEERLQRWQKETVERVHSENAGLRAEVADLKTLTARLPIMEACLRLAVEALHHVAPDAPELRHIGALLREAVPVDMETPDAMRDLLDKLK